MPSTIGETSEGRLGAGAGGGPSSRPLPPRRTPKRGRKGLGGGTPRASAKDPQVVVVRPGDLKALCLQPLDDLVVVGRSGEIAGHLLRVGDPLAPGDAGLHLVEVAHAQADLEGHRRGALAGSEDRPRDHRPLARALEGGRDGPDAPREGYPGRGECGCPGLHTGNGQYHRQDQPAAETVHQGHKVLYDRTGPVKFIKVTYLRIPPPPTNARAAARRRTVIPTEEQTVTSGSRPSLASYGGGPRACGPVSPPCRRRGRRSRPGR